MLLKWMIKEYIIAGPKNSNEAYAYRVTRLGDEIEYTSIGTLVMNLPGFLENIMKDNKTVEDSDEERKR